MVFALYYYILVIGTIYLSAKLKNNTAVLTMSLAGWMLWTIFLPKILGNTSEKVFRLPSRQAFQTAMQEDRAKGIDGHNPSDKREKELKEKVLKEYNVTDVKDLPINYDGIRMQADEEYGNQVWDKHFGNNYTLLKKQKTFYQLSGIINPFISLQNLSMGLCGTDMHHHIHFLQQAELYRRNFIKMLNDRHAFGGSKTGEWEWTEKNEFFKSIKDFEYRNPALGSLLQSYRIDLLCLIGWAALITTIVLFKEKKKEYV
jgi:ABC-2 type transport system permease protein